MSFSVSNQPVEKLPFRFLFSLRQRFDFGFWRFTLRDPCDIIGMSCYPDRKGVLDMHEFLNFIISVMASVAANYISKWLDGEDE